MNVSRLLSFIRLITAAEAFAEVDGALQALINLAGTGHGSSHKSYQDALENFVGQIGTVTSSLENYDGIEAVDLLGLRPITFDFAEEIVALSNLYVQQTAMLAERLKSIRQARLASIAKLRTTQAELVRIGFSPDDPVPGTIDIGFLIPRSLFYNGVRSFSEELRKIDELIKASSTVATGSAITAELVSINTSNPFLWVHADSDTAKLIMEAYKFAVELAKDLIVAKNAFDAIRKFLPNDQHEKAVKTRDDEFEARVEAEVDKKVAEYAREQKPDQVALGRVALSHAYRNLVIQVEGGMQLRVRAGIEGVVEQDKLSEFIELLEAANRMVHLPAPVDLSHRLTDERLQKDTQ